MSTTIKIAEISKKDDWYNIKTNDGKNISVLASKCPKLSEVLKDAKEGTEVTGALVEKGDKIYLWDPKTFGSKGGGGYKEETPEKQAIILAQSQMDNACNLVNAGIVVIPEGKKVTDILQPLASSLMTITLANAQAFIPYLKAYQAPVQETKEETKE